MGSRDKVSISRWARRDNRPLIFVLDFQTLQASFFASKARSNHERSTHPLHSQRFRKRTQRHKQLPRGMMHLQMKPRVRVPATTAQEHRVSTYVSKGIESLAGVQILKTGRGAPRTCVHVDFVSSVRIYEDRDSASLKTY